MDGLKLVKNVGFYKRINSNIKQALKETAKKKGITMSDYVDDILIDALKKDGVEIELSKKII